jgi:hypothetical protein
MRIDKVETAGIFGSGEARDIFMWPRAERYRILQGEIFADGERLAEDDRPYDENGKPRKYLNFSRQSPLSDPQLFKSFARLASHNGPSHQRILNWVHEHGLLHRADTNRSGDAFMPDGGVNQAPMAVLDFRTEVYFLRALLELYVQIREHRTKEIESRISNPTSPVDEALALGFDIEAAFTFPNGLIDPRGMKYLQALSTMPFGRAPNVTLHHADEVLCDLVSKKLEGIRPRLARGFALPREASSLTVRQLQSLPEDEAKKVFDPPKTYRLQPSWSCSDLLGSIYLQFFLWVSGNKPVRICENERCRMPFPLTRKDKRFCSDSCAGGARYHRKKESR